MMHMPVPPPPLPPVQNAVKADPLKTPYKSLHQKEYETNDDKELAEFVTEFNVSDVNIEELEDYKLIKDILFNGVDLVQYSQQIETHLSQVEKESISDYFAKRDTFVELYKELATVDSVLARFESLLGNFHSDLQSVSSDFRRLQDEALSRDQKLKNRRIVEEQLSKFVLEVSVPKELDILLSKGPIDSVEYPKNLAQLDRKLTIADGYKSDNMLAIQSTLPQLHRLLNKATTRLQKHLNSAVVSFKSLSERRQKQQELCNAPFLYQFLFKYMAPSAKEVLSTYIDTCERFYTSYFRGYVNILNKMIEDHSSKKHLIGTPPSKTKKGLGFHKHKRSLSNGEKSTLQNSTSNSSITNIVTPFGIGNRGDILSSQNLEAPSIEPPSPATLQTPGQSEKSTEKQTLDKSPASIGSMVPPFAGISMSQALSFVSHFDPRSSINITQRYPYEELFRSQAYFLMEVISAECLFVFDFFLESSDIIKTIFEKSTSILVDAVESYISTSYDIIAILIVLCIAYKFQKIMAERRISIMNDSFNAIINIAQKRFMTAFEANLTSVSDSLNAPNKDLRPIELTPHPVAKRLGDYLVTLAILSEHVPEDYRFHFYTTTHKLMKQADRLINKMSQEFLDKKEQTVFLIANYGWIVTTATDRGVFNTSAQNNVGVVKDINFIQKGYDFAVNQFLDDQIKQFKYFTTLINFSNEWGPLVENKVKIDLASNPQFNSENVSSILREFDLNWKNGVEEVKKVLRKNFFSAPSSGSQILSTFLNTLQTHYKVITLIVEDHFKELRSSKYFRAAQVDADMRQISNLFE